MESKQLSLLYKTFDDFRHENGVEYWYASELFPVLGYSSLDDFKGPRGPINRAIEACKNSGADVGIHFSTINKIQDNQDSKDAEDIKFTRYACYLIALNGDPRKPEIAFAQAYFVTQTRKIEVLQQKMNELERLDAREKLKITEKEFGDMAFSRGVDGLGIAHIRSAGDKALFGGKTTEEMKIKLGISNTGKPLADVLPSVTLKAKDLATAMTTENVRRKNLSGKPTIFEEHKTSNFSVRSALTSTQIFPENLPPAEDIKKIEAQHRKERKELEQKQRQELAEASKQVIQE